MGYDTSYKLEIFPNCGEATSAFLDGLRGQNEEASYALLPNGETNNSDARWYKHEDDMRAFSKWHPSFIFKLHGDGEEQGDVWVKYFKGGKMQECKIITTFAPYDESKLE